MAKPVLLFVSAQSGAHRRANIDEEERLIRAALEGSDRVALKTRPACTWDDLLNGLDEHQPFMLHIACHGEAGGIWFADEFVAQDHIVEELEAHDALKVLVTTACQSASLARALSGSIQQTIGMGDDISSDAACVYTKGFYRPFKRTIDVQASHAAGVRAVRKDHPEEGGFPRMYPELVDAATPERPRTLPPAPMASPDPARHRDDEAVRLWLIELLSHPERPAFDELLRGQGRLAEPLLALNAEAFLRLLMNVVREQPILKDAARQLAMHQLPRAVDWQAFEDAYRRAPPSGDQPHLVLPFSHASLCELVAARVQGRPARLTDAKPITQLKLPAAAQVGLLDHALIAERLTENILVKAGMPVPDSPAERLKAANTVLTFRRDEGGLDGERLQMHLVFDKATPQAIAAVRRDLDALFLIQTSDHRQLYVSLFLQQLFEWPTP